MINNSLHFGVKVAPTHLYVFICLALLFSMMDWVNDVKEGKLGKVCDKEKLSVGEAIDELVQNPKIKETMVIIAQNSGWRFLPLECSSH